MQRLDDCHGQKVSILMNELHSLEKDLESIDSSEMFVRNQSENFNSKIEFLIRHPSIKMNLENFIAKPFKKSIEVYPYDLPREMNQLRLIKKNKNSLLISIK